MICPMIGLIEANHWFFFHKELPEGPAIWRLLSFARALPSAEHPGGHVFVLRMCGALFSIPHPGKMPGVCFAFVVKLQLSIARFLIAYSLSRGYASKPGTGGCECTANFFAVSKAASVLPWSLFPIMASMFATR